MRAAWPGRIDAATQYFVLIPLPLIPLYFNLISLSILSLHITIDPLPTSYCRRQPTSLPTLAPSLPVSSRRWPPPYLPLLTVGYSVDQRWEGWSAPWGSGGSWGPRMGETEGGGGGGGHRWGMEREERGGSGKWGRKNMRVRWGFFLCLTATSTNRGDGNDIEGIKIDYR